MPEGPRAKYSVEAVAMSILAAGLNMYEETGDMDAGRAVVRHHRNELIGDLTSDEAKVLDGNLIDLLLAYYFAD